MCNLSGLSTPAQQTKHNRESVLFKRVATIVSMLKEVSLVRPKDDKIIIRVVEF